jgi:glc operon protein GlcG
MQRENGSEHEEAGIDDAVGEPGWHTAHAMVGAVLAEAARRQLSVAVAIVDRWGRMVAFQREARTTPTSANIAIAKAFTASNFDESVRVMVEQISREDQEELVRQNGLLCFLQGGLPIRRDGHPLGGIGVSGAPPDVDDDLAIGALLSHGYDDTVGSPA